METILAARVFGVIAPISDRWLAHSQQVRAELGQFDATMAETESAQRDYLLIGTVEHQAAERYRRRSTRRNARRPDPGGH